jgi:hypothetical protein
MCPLGILQNEIPEHIIIHELGHLVVAHELGVLISRIEFICAPPNYAVSHYTHSNQLIPSSPP